MLTVTVQADTTQTEKTISTLIGNIAALEHEMPRQFMAWQVEDMRRVKTNRYWMTGQFTAETDLWRKTSQQEQEKARKRKLSARPRTDRAIARALARKQAERKRDYWKVRTKKRRRRKTVRSPILRHFLRIKLRNRMRMMLKRVAPWA